MCLSVSPQFACLCQPRCRLLSCVFFLDRNATPFCWLFLFWRAVSHIAPLISLFSSLLLSCETSSEIFIFKVQKIHVWSLWMSTHVTVQHVELKQHQLHFSCIYWQGHRVSAGARQPKQKCNFSTMLHVTHGLQKNTNLTHPGWKIASPARMRRYASSPITGSADRAAVPKPPEMAETLSCSFRSFYGRHSPHSVVWQCCGGDRLSNKPWPLQPVTSPPRFSC